MSIYDFIIDGSDGLSPFARTDLLSPNDFSLSKSFRVNLLVLIVFFSSLIDGYFFFFYNTLFPWMNFTP